MPNASGAGMHKKSFSLSYVPTDCTFTTQQLSLYRKYLKLNISSNKKGREKFINLFFLDLVSINTHT